MGVAVLSFPPNSSQAFSTCDHDLRSPDAARG